MKTVVCGHIINLISGTTGNAVKLSKMRMHRFPSQEAGVVYAGLRKRWGYVQTRPIAADAATGGKHFIQCTGLCARFMNNLPYDGWESDEQ
ncbi:MAG: hypothetical protein M1422_00275 [Candidatus Thermoplasmatota archaeon]|jgi:hypothetical protein|nr:hypothetical protein [Candidatus Sysuiplasma jiujiangense]MBX8639377.1 hypothetical protein [Candidatus Sysuiplasma jiujiangense]MBX8642728.1 hypothetical protein [Candidatus Sysuiplasma jiujiangense]MCL4316696.1 hypothetical protein [Candidatus Thermoplasmatota archaeon]